MIHNFDPYLIDLGFLKIKWYSIAYILGILIGWAYANIIIKKILKKYNYELIKQRIFDDLIIYLVIGIILGGRLGYVLFYNLEYFSENILEIFKIWKGGMSFHGGLIGVILVTFIFSKRNNINFFKVTDIIACVTPIGIFFGRIANFINGELYGKISNIPFYVIFPEVDYNERHPSQIYEALLEGIALFLIINFFAIKKGFITKPGLISNLFLIFYAVFRIFSEIFREPDQHIGYIFSFVSVGMILSIIMMCAGLIMFFFIKKNEKNN